MVKIVPDKPTEGTGEFSLSINVALEDNNYIGHMALCRRDKDHNDQVHPCDPTEPENFYYFEVDYNDGKKTDLCYTVPYSSNNDNSTNMFASVYDFKAIRPGDWGVYYMENLAKSVGMKSLSKDQVLVNDTGVKLSIGAQGGVYALVLSGQKDKPDFHINRLVPDNVVSILWQVPQIVVITVAEILFSITGYEFAYSQAAPSMKALVQALWLLTTAIGDSIIVLIAALNIFSDGAVQAFVYAGKY